MQLNGLVAVFLCVAVWVSPIVVGLEYGCTYTSHRDGKFYDLSLLSDCNNDGYTVVSSNDGTFVINICNTLQPQQCGGTSVCQDGTYDCGNAAKSQFSDLANGTGVVLTYTGGASCPNSVNRQTILNFLCDPHATTPVFSFLSESPECTYRFEVVSAEACPKPVAPQKELCTVNVFLVPHTHDDVGWLLTVEDYYQQQVKHILDTTVQALLLNQNRTFIYVEQAFFTMWWLDPLTTDSQRNAIRQFVKEGRWEFVIGAWVMPDEACTTYGAVIDQMTLGHQFLLNTFGVTPSKGWQIDPFGASSAIPVIEKLSGFDAHLIDRITNKGQYESSRELQFNWVGSPSLGDEGAIFSEILGGGGYCDWLFAFDFSNNPVNDSNVATYGQRFVDMAHSYSLYYKTQNVLAEWGCDFAFQNALPMFQSMDKLITWLQNNEETTRIKVHYSVLSDYYNSVWSSAKAKNIEWETNSGGDFLPYFTGCWWTGYYTSRVQLKGLVRKGEASSHLLEPLFALGRLTLPFDNNIINKTTFSISYLDKANGYAQHHDGVTGTSVPAVVQMYEDYLLNGIGYAKDALSDIINLWIRRNSSSGKPNLVSGTNALLSIGSGQTVVLVLFNSLGWTRSDVLVLPVNRTSLTVYDSQMNVIPSQVSPAAGGNVTSLYDLSFPVKLRGLGYSTVFVTAASSDLEEKQSQMTIARRRTLVNEQQVVFQNNYLVVNFSDVTKRMESVSIVKSQTTLAIDQNLLYYTSLNSGAYCFGPSGPAVPITQDPPVTTILDGPVCSEITQTFSPFARQTIRLYHSKSGEEDIENMIEMLFDVGPLPSRVEVVTHFSSSIMNNEALETDDNGFQTMKRSNQWGNGIAGNYYPTVYSASISDPLAQLTVISDRSHGVSSQLSGDLEVMIHRNPDMGDGFGPGLTDTTEVFPSIRVLLDTPSNSLRISKKQSYLLNFPVSVFSTTIKTVNDWINQYLPSNSFLQEDLPANVHLLSFNPMGGSAILRLVHLYDIGEDPVFSQPVTLDIDKLFVGISISKISEVTLTGNKVLNVLTSPIIVLNPKEIRSFILDF